MRIAPKPIKNKQTNTQTHKQLTTHSDKYVLNILVLALFSNSVRLHNVRQLQTLCKTIPSHVFLLLTYERSYRLHLLVFCILKFFYYINNNPATSLFDKLPSQPVVTN
jgi:hypothetical protein